MPRLPVSDWSVMRIYPLQARPHCETPPTTRCHLITNRNTTVPDRSEPPSVPLSQWCEGKRYIPVLRANGVRGK
eukprot:8926661-Pyramimonas_sp.AAC.1